MWDMYKRHTLIKCIYAKPLSIFKKMFFNVDNTVMITQQESEKAIQKSDIQSKGLLGVRIFFPKKTTS